MLQLHRRAVRLGRGSGDDGGKGCSGGRQRRFITRRWLTLSSPQPLPAPNNMGRGLEYLQAYVERKKETTTPSTEQDVELEFLNVQMRRQEARHKTHSSFKEIPSFFSRKAPPLPAHDDAAQAPSLHDLLRKISREELMRDIEGRLLESDDVDELFTLFNEIQSEPQDDSHTANYDDYCMLQTSAPETVRHIFTAKLFLQFERDIYGRISLEALLHYIMFRDNLVHQWLDLFAFDVTGNGTIKDTELEAYISQQVALMPNPPISLGPDVETSLQFYTCTARALLTFMHDDGSTGHMRISDLVLSPHFRDFMLLRHPGATVTADNWFSAESFSQIFQQYLTLDTDQNGLLSPAEMCRQRGFTAEIIARLFEESHTFGGEIDFRVYCEFQVAWLHRSTPKGIKYFFKLLDLKKRGFLTMLDVNYFLRAIRRETLVIVGTLVNVEDVKDELFDIVKPANPDRITLDDLITCRQGGTVIAILADWQSFYEHDNKENQLAASAADDQET